MFTLVVFLGQGSLVVGQEEESLCPWIVPWRVTLRHNPVLP